jgi:hypothetical protein
VIWNSLRIISSPSCLLFNPCMSCGHGCLARASCCVGIQLQNFHLRPPLPLLPLTHHQSSSTTPQKALIIRQIVQNIGYVLLFSFLPPGLRRPLHRLIRGRAPSTNHLAASNSCLFHLKHCLSSPSSLPAGQAVSTFWEPQANITRVQRSRCSLEQQRNSACRGHPWWCPARRRLYSGLRP